MNPGEHAVMAEVEERHWWYRGLRDLLRTTIRRFGLPDQPRVLDAGCGTGENLKLLGASLEPAYLGGFDSSEEALSFARQKAPGVDLYQSDICDPELRIGDLDLVISMDVIYIPGREKAFAGLRTLVEALKPGGLFIMDVPAYEWLYSRHDVAVHTSQRFTAGGIRSLFGEMRLDVEALTYRLCLLFPLIVATRLPSMWQARGSDESVASELHSVPGALVSGILYGALRTENAMIGRGLSMPFGSSVYAVGRKPAR